MSKIYVDEIAPKTAGRVIAPQVNAFALVTLTSANSQDTSNPYAPSNATAIKFDMVTINRGSVYDSSTGRFTAPVAGIYRLSFSLLKDDESGGVFDALVRKNGSSSSSQAFKNGRAYSNDSNYAQVSGFGIFEMESGDYLELITATDSFKLYIDAQGNYNNACFEYLGA